MEENKKCITFNQFIPSSNHNAMNDCIDATYVIHLENNGRMENIQKQLDFYAPTDTIFIVVNKGFRKCEKTLPKQQPPHDLVDMYLQIFKHAEENDIQGNILILEDDFIWSTEIKRLNISSISNFLNAYKEKEIAYHLGVIPFMHIPVNFYNNYLLLGGGSHSVIYTKPVRQRILKTDASVIHDWDIFLNSYITRYYYYMPLCYQLFPETDNQQYWGIHNPIYHLFSYPMISLYRFLELDRKAEPGFSIFYYLSVIPLYMIILLVFLILFFIMSLTGIQSYRKYKLRDILQKIKAKLPWTHIRKL